MQRLKDPASRTVLINSPPSRSRAAPSARDFIFAEKQVFGEIAHAGFSGSPEMLRILRAAIAQGVKSAAHVAGFYGFV
jgi:hypothetical protein